MMASQIKAFALLGDSNIQPHVNKASCRAIPGLKNAQVLPCGHLEIFLETLRKVKAEVDVCLVSCLTNFITGASDQGPPTLSHRVAPVLQNIVAALAEFCTAQPERLVLISPPMYRTSPLWYREGLPEVLSLFSQAFRVDKPVNLHLLPSFPTPAFEADGVHLTAYSGLEYIMHLFDSADDLCLKLESSPEAVLVQSCESSRVLEDRVMVLEQDHRRLNNVVERRTAIEAELADFHANEKFEDSFVISGLSPISSDLVGKAWQDQAVKNVQAVLLILMGREYPIVFVQNSTSRAPGSEVKYTVKMSDVADSRSIRKKFGSFFLGGGGKDSRPEALLGININNRVTPETATRVEVRYT